jgi:hypothetical protein
MVNDDELNIESGDTFVCVALEDDNKLVLGRIDDTGFG